MAGEIEDVDELLDVLPDDETGEVEDGQTEVAESLDGLFVSELERIDECHCQLFWHGDETQDEFDKWRERYHRQLAKLDDLGT